MGRVPQAEAAPPSSTLKHFTHPHDLHPLSLYSPQTLCSGCKLQSSGTMYACTPCNFTLHRSCAKLPPLITHPSHGGCTLSLLTSAAYPGGRFSCNACARTSADSWLYHCGSCDYDLHVTCASKPLKIKHRAHTACGVDGGLDLTFKNPYMDVEGFSCDVCSRIGKQQWLYRCNSCEFDLHMDCAAAAAPRPALQQQRSAPPIYHHAQLAHSTSGGGMISPHGQYAAAAQQVNGFVGPPQPQVNGFAVPQQPHLMHSASAGAIGNQYAGNMYRPSYVAAGGNPPAAVSSNGRVSNVAGRVGRFGGNMVAAAMQGIVGGAMQAVGQAVVQDVFCGGEDMSSC